MDYKKDYLPLLKKMVKPKRYIHSLGVIDEAINLSKLYNANQDKARIAASLHDIAKYIDRDEQKEMITKTLGPDVLEGLPEGALHSICGAIYARDYLGIDDIDIYNAIYNHTLGKPNMSLLEKIIFVADFIEPSRNTEASKICKKMAYDNLDEALLYAMEYVANEREELDAYVPQITYDAINYYKEIINEQKTRNSR